MTKSNLLEQLTDGIKSFSEEDQALIQQAYQLSETKHAGQKRASGEEYIIHPINVALNLLSLGGDRDMNIAGLSTVYPKSWKSESKFTPESINVSFMIPVDSYKKTERSLKYALLFLIIPFIALLISEIFSKVRIHPIQYCLIGFADVIFYLLLLSISEHLMFDLTYLICAVCVCLATLFYAVAIFGSRKWGGLVSIVQFISYIFLYGTLQAEDYALLVGSIGLFAVIVLLMFITRKIDWYELDKKDKEE